MEKIKLDLVAHTCNSSTWEVGSEGTLRGQGQPGLTVNTRPNLTNLSNPQKKHLNRPVSRKESESELKKSLGPNGSTNQFN